MRVTFVIVVVEEKKPYRKLKVYSFWTESAQRGEELGAKQIPEFLEKENLIIDSAETQHVDDLL